MNAQLKDNIINLISYYRQHKVENMVKTHPSFVVDDFTKLLSELEKELEND